MILTPSELVELYEGVVKPFGHPDPLGFITRALIESGGDPDYIDVDGKQGFMPVLASRANEMTGSEEVQSLQSNLVSTLTMDRLIFQTNKSIDEMMIIFHFGENSIDDGLTKEHKSFITDVNDSRQEALSIMYPPFATVQDIIKALDPSNVDTRLTNEKENFFKFLLGS